MPPWFISQNHALAPVMSVGVGKFLIASRNLALGRRFVGVIVKVSKGAKIRNRYNQVPHLTQDTNGKVTNSQ